METNSMDPDSASALLEMEPPTAAPKPQPERTKTAEKSASVWAVVLGYNGVELTLASLASLQNDPYPNLTVLFTDNGSRDDSVARVQAEFPRVKVLIIPDNIGFARGCNAGMAYAMQQGADYVLLLNNDIKADSQMVSKLVAAAEADPKVGIVIPKIYYYEPGNVVWSAGCRLISRFPARIALNDTPAADDGRYDDLKSVELATLCAALIRRQVIDELGLLDPNFFLLWEDYEYCTRVRRAGYLLRHVPDAHLWHKVSMTIKEGKPSPFSMRYRGRSKSLFVRKYPEYGCVCWPGYPYAAALGFLLSGKAQVIRPFLSGFREGKKMALEPVPRWQAPLDGNARPAPAPAPET